MKLLITSALISISLLTAGQSADSLYQHAQEQFNNGEFETSLKLSYAAFVLDTTQVDYIGLFALSLLRLGKAQEAFDTYTLAIDRFPEAGFLYNNRGNLLNEYQEFDLAIADFTQGYDLALNDTIRMHLLVNRGAARFGKRDFEGSYSDYILALQIIPDNLAALVNLGAVCDEVGRGDETLVYLQRALEIDSTYIPAIGNIGFKHQEAGRHDEAIAHFNKVIQLDPEEPLGYSNRGYSLLMTGDLEGAMNDINRSIELYSTNPYAYWVRALIYLERGQITLACSDLWLAKDRGYTTIHGEKVEDLLMLHCK